MNLSCNKCFRIPIFRSKKLAEMADESHDRIVVSKGSAKFSILIFPAKLSHANTKLSHANTMVYGLLLRDHALLILTFLPY